MQNNKCKIFEIGLFEIGLFQRAEPDGVPIEEWAGEFIIVA